jgi:murein DD-endopeptidase MepM/ murein hydrolase activator NlpD
MHALAIAYTAFSFRNELKIVILAFMVVLLLPFVGLVVLVNTGINVISDKLVAVEEETQTIQILDPVDGSVVSQVEQAVAWPVHGVTTLEFGESSGYQVFHTGLDIANGKGVVGDSITPIMDGTVLYEGELSWGYGKHIIIDHGNNITSLYAHLDKIYVYQGQPVKIGDEIGKMGDTGWSTGPHLHLEVRVNSIPVNPRRFLL